MPYGRRNWNDSFANNVWTMYHKFLFWKRQRWYKNDNSKFAAFICMKCFGMFPHFYAASFSIKSCFYENSNVISRHSTRLIFKKLLAVCINKGYVTLEHLENIFRNFTYSSSYLQTKTWMETRLHNIFKT